MTTRNTRSTAARLTTLVASAALLLGATACGSGAETVASGTQGVTVTTGPVGGTPDAGKQSGATDTPTSTQTPMPGENDGGTERTPTIVETEIPNTTDPGIPTETTSVTEPDVGVSPTPPIPDELWVTVPLKPEVDGGALDDLAGTAWKVGVRHDMFSDTPPLASEEPMETMIVAFDEGVIVQGALSADGKTWTVNGQDEQQWALINGQVTMTGPDMSCTAPAKADVLDFTCQVTDLAGDGKTRALHMGLYRTTATRQSSTQPPIVDVDPAPTTSIG